MTEITPFEGADAFAFNDIDAPLPTDLPPMHAYWLAVMPIAPRKKTAGGIILPDQFRDAEAFMNALGRIVSIGEGCFQSAKLREDLKMTTFPKVGEIIRYSGARNRELLYDGVTLVDVRDDMVRQTGIREDQVAKFQFWR